LSRPAGPAKRFITSATQNRPGVPADMAWYCRAMTATRGAVIRAEDLRPEHLVGLLGSDALTLPLAQSAMHCTGKGRVPNAGPARRHRSLEYPPMVVKVTLPLPSHVALPLLCNSLLRRDLRRSTCRSAVLDGFVEARAVLKPVPGDGVDLKRASQLQFLPHLAHGGDDLLPH